MVGTSIMIELMVVECLVFDTQLCEYARAWQLGIKIKSNFHKVIITNLHFNQLTNKSS